jgi:hypothetical protein
LRTLEVVYHSTACNVTATEFRTLEREVYARRTAAAT